VQFRFPNAEDTSKNISLRDVGFSYSGRMQGHGFYLDNINMKITSESRIGLVGPNGAGKSTLLALIAGQLEALHGVVDKPNSIKVAVFRQHHADSLELDETPLSTMRSRFPGEQDQAYRAHLGSFGLVTRQCTQPIRSLSGGERSRLAFSLLTFNNRPHVLLLDEPTNHLSAEARRSLAQALI
ncbi:hypothetical protein KIPB_012573, partial [Kipferlia bialata]